MSEWVKELDFWISYYVGSYFNFIKSIFWWKSKKFIDSDKDKVMKKKKKTDPLRIRSIKKN